MSWEKEMRKMITDKSRHLKMNDKIRFRCLMCGRCCWNKDITLNSYDIARLKRSLNMKTTDMRKAGFLNVYIGANSGLTVCTINFVGDEQNKRCPFLAPVVTKGDTIRALNEIRRKGINKDDFQREFFKRVKDKIITLACGVYPDRPTVCRAYPVGRCIKKRRDNFEDDETIWFRMDTPNWCGARDTEYTLKEWLDKEEYWHYREGSDLFYKIIDKMVKSGMSTKPADFAMNKKPFSKETMSMFAGMLYNFDASPVFKEEPDKMDHIMAMSIVKRIHNLITLMCKKGEEIFRGKR